MVNIKKLACGRPGDGRYIIPDDPFFIDDAILLSFGVNDDISFEKDFLARTNNSKVICFDPAIEKLPEVNTEILFYKLGLSGSVNKNKNLTTLENILKQANVSPASKIVLKIDIEGWEWPTFEYLLRNNFKLDLIIVEFHFLLFNNLLEKVLFPVYFIKRYNIFKKLLSRYSIFHIHANNYRYTFFKDFIFPEVIELTLISNDNFIKDFIKEVKELNSPNCFDKIDIQYPFIKKEVRV